MRPIVYMVHPEHGRMPVYSVWVEQDNLKHGWTFEEQPAIEPATLDELTVPKRRGRPPKA